jgi:hypothetical protein
MNSKEWTDRFNHPTRDEIVDRVAEALGIEPDDEDEMEQAGIILFDGMEEAFVGVAERFEPVMVRGQDGKQVPMGGQHQFFAVYSYAKMIEVCQSDGMDRDEAIEYLEFNTLGAYVGEQTPAIIHDERE